MEVIDYRNKSFHHIKREKVDNAIMILQNTFYKIKHYDEILKISKPNSPYTISTLQQESSSKL